MEEVTLVLSKAQILRLRLLVEYEIRRNEVLRVTVCVPPSVEHCCFEIEKFNEILDKLIL